MKPRRFLSRPGQAGSRHSRDDIFQIDPSPPDEKRPALFNISLYIIKYTNKDVQQAYLTFLKGSQAVLEKRFSQSLRS